MKKIKTTIKTMLLAAIVLVMAQGCIPITPIGPSGGTANPNIIHKMYNYSLNIASYGSYEMDLDNDGTNDIKFVVDNSFGSTVSILAMPNKDIRFASKNFADAKSYVLNELILQDNLTWIQGSVMIYNAAQMLGPYKLESVNSDATYFLGIQATDANNNNYYAWLRFKYNVLATTGNIQIMESGVHKTSNANIKAGEY